MNFFLNVVFWGERYTRFFLDYSLPSQLAAGNIPYMYSHNKGTIRYRIYTTREDAVLVVNSPVYAKLCELVEVEIVDFEEFDLYNCHYRGTMTLCHAHAIQFANANDYSLMFIWPDILFSCNALGTLFSLAISGKTTVYVGSLGVHTGNFLEELARSFVMEGGALTIPPRALVDVGVRNLSVQSQQWLSDSPNFHKLAPWIFWKVPGEGLLQRAFHLTPMLLTPDDKTLALHYIHSDELTLDGNDYVAKAVHDFASIHVIDDSDDFCCISFNDDMLPIVPNRLRTIDVALHALRRFLPHHFSLFPKKLRFHTTEISTEWSRTEENSDLIVNDVLRLIQLAETYPEIPTIYNELIDAIDENKILIHVACAEMAKGKYNTAEALNELGEFQLKFDEKDRAIDNFAKAIELVPDLLIAHLNLAQIYFQQDKLMHAFTHIRSVMAIDPCNNDAIKLADKIINN